MDRQEFRKRDGLLDLLESLVQAVDRRWVVVQRVDTPTVILTWVKIVDKIS